MDTTQIQRSCCLDKPYKNIECNLCNFKCQSPAPLWTHMIEGHPNSRFLQSSKCIFRVNWFGLINDSISNIQKLTDTNPNFCPHPRIIGNEKNQSEPNDQSSLGGLKGLPPLANLPHIVPPINFNLPDPSKEEDPTAIVAVPLPCPICASPCHNLKALRSHLLVHTVRKKKFKCSFKGCNFSTTTLLILKGHQRLHKMEKRGCRICQVELGAKFKVLKCHCVQRENENKNSTELKNLNIEEEKIGDLYEELDSLDMNSLLSCETMEIGSDEKAGSLNFLEEIDLTHEDEKKEKVENVEDSDSSSFGDAETEVSESESEDGNEVKVKVKVKVKDENNSDASDDVNESEEDEEEEEEEEEIGDSDGTTEDELEAEKNQNDESKFRHFSRSKILEGKLTHLCKIRRCKYSSVYAKNLVMHLVMFHRIREEDVKKLLKPFQ